MKKLSESIWSDMQDRSSGETVREEDMITTNKDLRRKILELHIEQGGGDTLDVSSLTNCIKCDDFSYIFSGFKRVKHIIGLENWDVSNVKNMVGMFGYCENFNCDLSKWDVSEVTDIHSMFYSCENFNSDLSNWDVSSVRNMHSMFYNCKNFNCDLSKWDVSSVGNMYGMFMGCKNFNSDLSKWNVSNVKNIGDVFNGCKSLKQIPSWYMKYYQKTNESIWSDMQDRSAGETIRKEDEKQHLFDTLTKLYPPTNSNVKIELRDNSIYVPLFKFLNTYSNLAILDDRKFVVFLTINPSKYNYSKYKKLSPIFSNLWKELYDNFTFVDFSDYDDLDHWHISAYKPKDGGLVDEKFCIKIIDCIIDFIDGTEDIIKIVNSSNDSRF